MESERELHFGSFRLKSEARQLWREGQEIELRPTARAVLHYLATHPGQVITKEDLRKEVWRRYVSHTVVKVCIHDIRHALGDDQKYPQFIETVGRQGYRFIGEAKERQQAVPAASAFVGRQVELAQLQQWLDQTLAHGQRTVALVAGEPGIGKTTLVDEFLDRLQGQGEVWIGRGQCAQQHGAGEAYLPVFEALEHLERSPRGAEVREIVERVAPSWMVQRTFFHTAALGLGGAQPMGPVTYERTLRELARACEALAGKTPLVLVFDDLHWGDVSTLEFLAYLARRREPAQLLVIGIYRPVEVIVSGHPLQRIKEELRVHGQCEELRLEPLTLADVTQYLRWRLATQQLPSELAAVIYERTDGNPLFMVAVVEDLLGQGILIKDQEQWVVRGGMAAVAAVIPEGVQELLSGQIMRLAGEAQRALEVASVMGVHFTAAAVAAVLDRDLETVEDLFDALAKHGPLMDEGYTLLADGGVSGQYRFFHALYQSVLYRQVPAARKARLHRSIGAWLEAEHQGRIAEVASELALH